MYRRDLCKRDWWYGGAGSGTRGGGSLHRPGFGRRMGVPLFTGIRYGTVYGPVYVTWEFLSLKDVADIVSRCFTPLGDIRARLYIQTLIRSLYGPVL